MQLISATPYRNGVVGLYYRPSDPADPTEDESRTGVVYAPQSAWSGR